MSELRLKVKPKPGDREPTPADYESIEEETEEDNLIEGDDGMYLICGENLVVAHQQR